MKAAKMVRKQLGKAQKQLSGAKKQLRGMRKGALAGAAGAALVVGNLAQSVKDRAHDIRTNTFGKQKKSREVIEVKKSTVMALLVALAAVAGVLGALYFYVLRREKELDEYEQLLFSEDFNDDLLDDVDELEDDPAKA